ncbi:glycosyltransferase family 4 protein [Reinekea sp. G2M2-21]|uniref:glycosyltransferase family 4 protein n=1 Tax=Reinekea sp. G2M2-21 TaxID=2788942 RepID=UPI0018AB1863|nr:glycosyltransferase family 4 protein [Reinekea sp. G2M2-21]
MKALIVDKAISFGGSLEVANRLARILALKGIKVELMTDCRGKDRTQIANDFSRISYFNFPITFLRESAIQLRVSKLTKGKFKVILYLVGILIILINSLAFAKLLWRIAVSGADIVHTNNSVSAALLGRIMRKKVIWHAHGPVEQSFTFRFAMMNCHRVISISRFVTSNLIQHGIDQRKIVQISNPLAGHSETRIKGEVKDIDIFSIGRLVSWKGQLELLAAIRHLKERNKNYKVIIAGDSDTPDSSYKKSLQVFVQDNNIGENVSFVGHITDAPAYYRRSKVFVHSSIKPEPFGLVITEAAQYGCAVICSAFGAGPELVTDKVTGLVVDPTKTSSLADAIELLVENTKLRDAMSTSLSDDINARFSDETIGAQVASLYQRLLKNETTV